MSDNIEQLKNQIVNAVSDVRVPLRHDKNLNLESFDKLVQVTNKVGQALKCDDSIPKSLAKELFDVFPALLTEASYADEEQREIIEGKAWHYQEILNRALDL